MGVRWLRGQHKNGVLWRGKEIGSGGGGRREKDCHQNGAAFQNLCGLTHRLGEGYQHLPWEGGAVILFFKKKIAGL